MMTVTVEAKVELVPARWEELTGGLIGYLDATYEELVAHLGEPERYDQPGDKVDVEWRLKDAAGMFGGFRLYNYKDGPNYLGRDGTPVEKITDWHVGGRRNESLKLLQAIFGERARTAW